MTTGSTAAQAAKFVAAVETWVRKQRWSPRTDSELQAVDLWDMGAGSHILVARIGNRGALLQIPLVSVPSDSRDLVTPAVQPVGIVDGHTLLFDATSFSSFWTEWAKRAQITAGTREELITAASQVRALGVEQSNTSVLLLGGEQPLIAKVFRVLHGGVHPEVELPAALTKDGWPGVPAVWAFWDLPHEPEEEPMCSAVVATAVRGAVDGFDHFVALAAEGADPYDEAHRIGDLVGSLHDQLTRLFGEGEPMPVAAVREQLVTALDDARTYGLAERAPAVNRHVYASDTLPENLTMKTSRIHGDLHLGQLLRDPEGKWVAVDFEGEPLRDLDSRRRKSLPMRDVAGMLRSFDYAAVTGAAASEDWGERARSGFLNGYDRSRPLTPEDVSVLEALELEKALYEVTYEGRFRPDRLPIPLAAVQRITEDKSDAR